MNIRILTFLFFLSSFFQADAQLYISPENPGHADEITLSFHAEEGNAELAGFQGDLYAHTGLITGESTGPGDWKQVASDWGQNKPELKFNKIAEDRYELKFRLDELYGVGPIQEIVGIAMVVRNADGSMVGRAKGGGDLYLFFKDPKFKTPPRVNEVSETPRPKWADDANIYEVNIRQYTPEGTFAAFAKHLPRLQKMGVDILWFMPIYPIGKKGRKGTLGSYYSISDYTAINPEFGTMEEFKNLVKQCHEMGFHVVLDWVANHTSRDHPWIAEHPDWYNWGDDGTPIATSGWTDVADLNYDNAELRKAMAEEMKFWLTECDIDGFRCDVAGMVPLDFWENTRPELEAVKPIWMLAEEASNLSMLNKAFNATYAWPMHHLMNEIAKGTEPAHRVGEIFDAIANEFPEGGYPMQFITNHDENSWNGTIFERLGDGHMAFATLIFTAPGMPLIYSGQEAAMKKRLEFFEKDPINWGEFVLADFYGKLNQLKKENKALWNGSAGGDAIIMENDKTEHVLSFVREKDGNKVVTVLNLSGEKQTVEINFGKHKGQYRAYFTKVSGAIAKRAKMVLKPWEYKVLIFEKETPEEIRTFKSATPTETGLRINVSDGVFNLSLYSENSIEVEFLPRGEANPPSYAIAAKSKKIKAEFSENENTAEYKTSGMVVKINKEPFQLSYFYKNKPLISEEKGFFDNYTELGFRFNLSPDEKLTGGGERALGMNRRGKRLQLYNKASYGYEETAELMYYSMPVVLSSKKYMLVFDNGASGHMDLGATEKDILQFETVGGRMSYFITASDDWKKLAENYTELTGRQPMPPRWALGNIASRMGYHSQNEVENLIHKYEEDEIPLDCVVLDLFWFGKDIKGHLGNLEWDLDSFPQPQKMLDDMEAKGIKTVLITEPFIVKNTNKYREVIEKELVGKNAKGEPYHYDFYFGNTLLLDIFKKETKDWFWEIYKSKTLNGVDGWWGDLGEPEVHPDDLLHVNGRADELHNLYGHEWGEMVFDGFKKDFPNERPVILMRSGFVGSQRYGMLPWSGDVNRSWGGLKPQVEIALTMGLQGLAYMHSDLGGFAGDYKDSELYIRWLQYGVFQPIYRTHAQEMVPSEPVFWDEKTKGIVKKYIDLRYQMMPYNYTLSHINSTTGVPMMRPLFYEEDNMELFKNNKAYLWGDAFLVSPVTEKGAATQKTYLPINNSWVDYWNEKKYDGGQVVSQSTKINEIPVFVKAGSFIPMTPVFKNMEQYNSEEISLHYYHDDSVIKADGQYYEDDGKTKDAYAKKKYELLSFYAEYEKGKLIFTIYPERYHYEGMPDLRNINMVIHGLEEMPKKIKVDRKKMREGMVWDAEKKTVSFTVTVGGEAKIISLK